MAKSRKRIKTPTRGAGIRRETKPPRAASRTAQIETLREQADRLGVLDALEDEPAHVFQAASADGSET